MSAALATALVVDDESMVRMLVRRMLEPDLCAVVEADNGEAAPENGMCRKFCG